MGQSIYNRQIVGLVIAAGVPTLAVFLAFIRNEFALATLGKRIDSLETRIESRIAGLEHRIENLDRNLREWARIVRQHNYTDIARLKDKAGLG